MQYKDGKIIQIIQEFSVSGNTYNLNGIGLINAVFFVREDRKKFRLLLPAEYKINVDGTNVNLEIQDGVLNNCISVQVGIDLNKLSDFYNPVGSPDIAVLKDKYNQLCQDMANLWEYVKKQGVSSDALNRDIVLPILKEGETWVFKDGEMKATPLIVAETELQKLLDELTKKSQDILDDYVATLTENSKTEILNFLEDNTENLLTKTEAEGIYVKNTLIASETKAGITTIEEMWKQDSLVIGGEFGGKFPVTNIEVGKVYYYFDSARNLYVPYTALKTATGTFNAPNAENFKESTFKGFLTQRKILLNTPVEIFSIPRDGAERNTEIATGHDYKYAEAIIKVYKNGTFDQRITCHAFKGGVFRNEESALTSSASAITNFEKSKYRLNMYPLEGKIYFDGVHYATGVSGYLSIVLELLAIYN